MILSESLTDTYIVYLIVKKLLKPWKEWDAYKLGIIDENGNKIKKPKTPEEKKAWTILDRLIWKVKRLLEKFVGKNKLIQYFAIAYLLKEDFKVIARANSKYLQLLEETIKNENPQVILYSYKLLKEIEPILKEKVRPVYDINEGEFLAVLTEIDTIEDLFEENEYLKMLEKESFR